MEKKKSDEIALMIKTGHADLYLDLWRSVESSVKMKAIEFASKTGQQDSIDDMLQEAYLVLPDAVEYYDGEQDHKSFSGVLCDWFLPKAFNQACYGGSTKTAFKEPLNSYISLDVPYSTDDDFDLTLLDLLVDERAEEYYRSIEDISFWESVGRLLRKGIHALPNRDQRDLLLWMLENDESVSDAHRQNIIGEKCRSWYGQVYKDGCRNLRRWIRNKGRDDARKTGIDDFIGTSVFYAGSVDYYRSHNYTSCTEAAALKMADDKERSRSLTRLNRMLLE